MALLVDTVIEDHRWEALDLAATSERAAQATLRALGLGMQGFQISLMGCDDARIAVLNADFRGKPTATNVLSWPARDRASEYGGETPQPPAPGTDADPELLGDIALAYDTCIAEALAQEKTAEHHVAHLIVHAVLHLLGFDHEDEADATLMEGHEVRILASMGIPDPY